MIRDSYIYKSNKNIEHTHEPQHRKNPRYEIV